MIQLYVQDEHLYNFNDDSEVKAWMDTFPSLYKYDPANVRTEYVEGTPEDTWT